MHGFESQPCQAPEDPCPVGGFLCSPQRGHPAPASVLLCRGEYTSDTALLLPLAEPALSCSGTCAALLRNVLGPTHRARAGDCPPSFSKPTCQPPFCQTATSSPGGKEPSCGQGRSAAGCPCWPGSSVGMPSACALVFSLLLSLSQFIPFCISYTSPGASSNKAVTWGAMAVSQRCFFSRLLNCCALAAPSCVCGTACS